MCCILTKRTRGVPPPASGSISRQISAVYVIVVEFHTLTCESSAGRARVRVGSGLEMGLGEGLGVGLGEASGAHAAPHAARPRSSRAARGIGAGRGIGYQRGA